LDYELLLPYDFEKLLKMETDVKRGVINSPQHQLVKILLDCNIKYKPAFLIPNDDKPLTVSRTMKDSEFAVAAAKQSRYIDEQNITTEKICNGELLNRRNVLCIVPETHMLGVKRRLQGHAIIRELYLDSKVEELVEEVRGGSSITGLDISAVEGDASPSGGAGLSRSEATSLVDGTDNTSRFLESGLMTSSLNDKLIRLEDCCIAIARRHGPGGAVVKLGKNSIQQVKEHWFIAAEMAYKRRYPHTLPESVLDHNAYHELGNSKACELDSIYYNLCLPGSSCSVQISNKLDPFLTIVVSDDERDNKMFQITIHATALADIELSSINTFVSNCEANAVSMAIVDFSTIKELNSELIENIESVRRALRESNVNTFCISGAGRFKSKIGMKLESFAKTPNLGMGLEQLAVWVINAPLNNIHPVYQIKPIDFLFCLEGISSSIINVIIAKECVKARLKDLYDSCHRDRFHYHQAYSLRIKDAIVTNSCMKGAQNYAFSLLGINVQVLSNSSEVARPEGMTSSYLRGYEKSIEEESKAGRLQITGYKHLCRTNRPRQKLLC